MIKLIRYNKGMLMSVAIKMQWTAVVMIICLPIFLGELQNRVIKDMDELIYIMQGILMSLGVIGYLTSIVIIVMILFAYKPLIDK
jgi:hypothetical protein